MALENLATATQANKTSVALLTKKVAELSIQGTTLTPKLETAQPENDRLKISGHRSADSGDPADHGHRSANRSAPSDHNPPRDQNIYSRSSQKFNPNGYCSYHRFKVEETHTSLTCTRPLHEHNKLETQLDTKG